MSCIRLLVAALLLAAVSAVPLELKSNAAREQPSVDSSLFSLLERDASTNQAYITEDFVNAFIEKNAQIDAPPCCDVSQIPTVIVATEVPTTDLGKVTPATMCFPEPFEEDDEEECARLGDKCPESRMDAMQLEAVREERQKERVRRKTRETADCITKATAQSMKQLLHVDNMANQVRAKFTDLQRMKASIKAQLESARQSMAALNEENVKDLIRIKAAQTASDQAAQKRILFEEEQAKREQKFAFEKFKEEQRAKHGIQKTVLESQKKDAEEQKTKQLEHEKLNAQTAQEQAQKLQVQLNKVKEQEELTKALLKKEGNESEIKAKIRANIASMQAINEANMRKTGFSCTIPKGCTTVNTDGGVTRPFAGVIEPSYGPVGGLPATGSQSGQSSQSGSSQPKSQSQSSGSSSASHSESSSIGSESVSGSAANGFINGKPVKLPRIDDPVTPKYLPKSQVAVGVNEMSIGSSKHKIEMHVGSESSSGASSSGSNGGSSNGGSRSGSSSESHSGSSKDPNTINWVPKRGGKFHHTVVQVVDKLGPATGSQIVSAPESSSSVEPDTGSDGGSSQSGSDGGHNGGDDGHHGGGRRGGANIIINIGKGGATLNGKHMGGGEHSEGSEHGSESSMLKSLVSKLTRSVSESVSSRLAESAAEHASESGSGSAPGSSGIASASLHSSLFSEGAGENGGSAGENGGDSAILQPEGSAALDSSGDF